MATDSTPSSEPFYTVQLNLQGCAYDVRVNDAPVYLNLQGLPLIVELPINRWIHDGADEISLHIRPTPGQPALAERTKCTAIIYVREKTADRESRREVARLEYPKTPATRREGGETIASASFPAAVPFGLFRWFTSPELNDEDGTMRELLRELTRYHELFASKDIDALLDGVRERDREDAMAQYTTLADQVANSRREYGLLMRESEYELRPLITKNIRLRLYGKRRLARVELISNGQPPLYYLTTDHQTAGYLPMIFCRDSEGKWVIIR